MNKPKFKNGETVLYKNGDTYQLGIIKRTIQHEKMIQTRLKQDGLNGEPSGPIKTETKYSYFVHYHTGDTSSCTPEHALLKINNHYAFLVIRRTAEITCLDSTPSRQLAAAILNDTQYKNEAYFAEEDRITKIINEYKIGGEK